jgi:mannose-6-phosphate isomerase-like protein (cupin superfamily)
MTTATSDLLRTFVHLHADASATTVPWGPDRWSALTLERGDWIVGAVHGDIGGFHPASWEMHPHGDELLHLLAGKLDVVFDEATGERKTSLARGGMCIVPRGVWHRLIIHEPSDLMFVTPGAGTEHRPV